MSNEFAGLGFAAGVVTGARSFKVDSLGRLTGIHYPQVWMPEENVAQCRKQEDVYTVQLTFEQMYTTIYGISGTIRTYPTVPTTTAPQVQTKTIPSVPPAHGRRKGKKNVVTHEVPILQPPTATTHEALTSKPHTMVACKCGFYGYYDGSDDYHKDGYVSAVIEGYGEALVGTRGFRVAKARIVALYVPTSVSEATGFKVSRNYASIPEFDSFRAMVTAFPPDGGEHAVKVMPDADSDFWTRSAK